MSNTNHEFGDGADQMLSAIDAVLLKHGASVSAGYAALENDESFIPLSQLIDGAGEGDEEEEVRMQVRLETFRGVLMYFVEDGLHPLDVLKRFYATLKAVRPDLLGGMSLEDIAVLSGDGGRATPQARIERIYAKRLKEAGFRGTKAPHQKTAGTAEKCAEAQRGNKNRRNGALRKRQG